ncbi:MAG: DUF4240 domain-containing protein [Gemmataceae bacterium]|nr:DUF4240 domain-containing protein [Gemmataceae bacterium]
MTEDEFWGHIAASEPDPLDPEAQVDRLAARLAKLAPDEIVDFQAHWERLSDRAYRRDLWDAAGLINGMCSDDGFQYFRWWLSLQGRAVYEAAVADPDTLAGVVDPEVGEYEAEVGPGVDAWFLATGTADDDDAGFEAFRRAVDARNPGHDGPPELVPDPRGDEDENTRFPRLAALYLGDESED